MLRLSHVIQALFGSQPQVNDFTVVDAEIDSRKVISGSLFIAIPGERVDGHAYVKDAFNRGASIALVQSEIGSEYPTIAESNISCVDFQALQPPFCIKVENTVAALQKLAGCWRQTLPTKIIGITGSVGKSTTKELVAEVLSTRYATLKNLGNMNNEIGLPLTLLKLTEGYQRAVLEMGFYQAGEIRLLCDIARPSIGVITNVGTVHAERSGSRESIAKGKAELIESLPADGVAILNHDDDLVRAMARGTKARVLFYGLSPEAELWAEKVTSLGMKGIQFLAHYHAEEIMIQVPLLGEHSVHTALRAVAVALADHLTWDEILTGLQSSTTQLRLVPSRSKTGAIIIDDSYNSSPESCLAALNLLDSLEGRKIAVLGDMKELGQYEELGHKKVGIRAAQVVDYLYTIGKISEITASAAKDSGLSSDHVMASLDMEPVIDSLCKLLRPGDVVLIKGSHSMHLEQIVAALEEK